MEDILEWIGYSIVNSPEWWILGFILGIIMNKLNRIQEVDDN